MRSITLATMLVLAVSVPVLAQTPATGDAAADQAPVVAPAPVAGDAEAAKAPVPAPAPATGDADAGKRLAYTCTGCHGITGYKNAYPSYHVPRISGQNYQYLVSALTAYQAGTRKHPTMAAQAQSLNAQDIANIAAYLSATPTP